MNQLRQHLIAICLAIMTGIADAQQTLVRFSTTLGDFDAVLYDQQTPVTTSNFLAYVDQGIYDDTFIHRSVPGFVIQGGGFTVTSNVITDVSTLPPIVNEAQLDNQRGTLTMARTSEPDSATSQWFINLKDNASLNPTTNAAGYAVFGRVLGSGMRVVDQLAAVQVYNASAALNDGTFSELPLLNPSLVTTNLLWIRAVERIPFGGLTIESGGDISWLSTNTPFLLQRSSGLASNDWVTVLATNASGSFIDMAAENQPRAFYRLSLPE
jgi:cyclophilin family peptidyl-prolyl cis-trans isomerase